MSSPERPITCPAGVSAGSVISDRSVITIRLAIQLAGTLVMVTAATLALRAQIAAMPAEIESKILATADQRYVKKETAELNYMLLKETQSAPLAIMQRDIAELRAEIKALPEISAQLTALKAAIDARK
jgi:hypothetical protein